MESGGEDGTRLVVVEVSADLEPVRHEGRSLLLTLVAMGSGLAAVALAEARGRSHRIVGTEGHALLQAAWERQARVTSNASHERRTLLAVVRTEVEVALRVLAEEARSVLGSTAGRVWSQGEPGVRVRGDASLIGILLRTLERFARVDAACNRDRGPAGLWLAIVEASPSSGPSPPSQTPCTRASSCMHSA